MDQAPRFRRPSLLAVLVLSLALAPRAFAADSDAAPDSATEAPTKRGPLFPPFRKKDRSSEAPAAEVAPAAPASAPEAAPPAAELEVGGPAPDVPAEEPPAEGIWEWVDRMEGEIPSDEQVEAIREVSEEHTAERGLIDDLAAGAVPLAFYDDPVKALAVDPLFLDRVDPSEFDIPVEVNEWVEKWVRYFTGPGRKYYERWLARSTRYQPMMRAELKKAGLPQDLVYLSMIESGYNAHAYSSADAAGLWQFIPSTGKLYDLRIDWWVDDRRDPEESLHAAIDFLGELHKMFGDWRLAWAAYNGGPGRVRRAIDRQGTKEFWAIVNGPHLHPETDNYAPKIMAAAIIGKHPERYGFTNIEYQEPLQYEKAHVDGAVELEVVARCAGVPLDDVKALNPALRRYATPPEGYDVRLPVGKKDAFLVALAEVPKEQRVTTVARHTVRRGETLSTIAAKYNTSVSAVSRANNLKNVNRIYVGMSLVIPKSDGQAEVLASTSSSASKPSTTSKAPVAAKPATHTVAKGESLSVIASRYGTTVDNIKRWNNLRSSTILVGQKLKVSSGTSSSTVASSSSGSVSSRPAATTTHTVQRGESLSSIASRYGVSASDLQRWNGISDPSHIEAGQKLKVNGGGSSSASSSSTSWTTYTVQRGDSLGKIATRYGCTVTQLQQWNSLSGSVIQPGQKLKVRRA